MLRRAATRALGPVGTRVVRVLSGPLFMARMELELAREKAYWSGTYERATQAALCALARRDAVAWDLGAHIGFFSLLLARRCASVVAVEAAAANRMLPEFAAHALWRPKAREMIGQLMEARDRERLKMELNHGVRLANSLGLDVSDVALPF